MLSEVGLKDFSLTGLGKRMNVTPMSFYKYFSNIDGLLEAAAERAFLTYELPAQGHPWQTYIRLWLHTLHDHFERYPVSLQVIAWNDRLSNAWLRVWLPVLEVLSTKVVESQRLQFIAHWFSLAALGLMNASINGPRRVEHFSEDLLLSLTSDHRTLLIGVHGNVQTATTRDLLAFGFDNIIAGLENLLTEASFSGYEKLS